MSTEVCEFVWYELTTPDLDAAQAFYRQVIADMPMSCWAYYVNVESTRAALERAKTGGGKVVNGAMQVPGGDWVAQCQDPQGALFSLVGPA